MPFITISSSARASGSDTDFAIVRDVQIADFTFVRMKQVTFYRTMYNVTDDPTNANNQLTFIVASDPTDPGTYTTLTISLTAGNYEINDMITALTAAINAALSGSSISSTVTITTSTITSKMTFALSGGYYVSFQPVASLYPNQGLNLILGLSRFNASPFGTSVTAPRVFNMSRYLDVYLLSNVVRGRTYCSLGTAGINGTTAGNNTGSLLPILGSIPINADFGSVVDYQERLAQPISMQPKLATMTFKLIDDQGYPISLNGTVLNIVLEVFN